MADHPVNKSCEKNFERVDKNIDDLEKKFRENEQKLTVLDANSKNIASDHDKVIAIDKQVEVLEDSSEKHESSLDKVTKNLTNFAALQNNMIDKLTELTKKEDKKNDVKTVILTGVLVTILGTIILFILQVFVNHAFKTNEELNSGLSMPKKQIEKTSSEAELIQILKDHIKK